MMKESEEKQFHIIIGETHISDIAIKAVYHFIQSTELRNVRVCLEHRCKESDGIVKNENSLFSNIYKPINKIALEQKTVDGFINKTSRIVKKYLENNQLKIRLYSTFGFDRQKSFNDFFQQKRIKFIGIDSKEISALTHEDRIKERDQNMAEELISLKKKITITIVGADHLKGLYNHLNGMGNYKFILVKDNRGIENFEYLKAYFALELKAASSSILNIKEEMGDNVELINTEDFNEMVSLLKQYIPSPLLTVDKKDLSLTMCDTKPDDSYYQDGVIENKEKADVYVVSQDPPEQQIKFMERFKHSQAALLTGMHSIHSPSRPISEEQDEDLSQARIDNTPKN